MWRLTNVPSQAMTTVYLSKQMIRLRSASSSWNTFERFLLKTHRGPAHAASGPPRCRHLGRSRVRRKAAAAGWGPAALLPQRSAPRRGQEPRSPSRPPIPAVAAAQRPTPACRRGGTSGVPDLRINDHFSWISKLPWIFQEPFLSIGQHLYVAATRQAGAWWWVVAAGSLQPPPTGRSGHAAGSWGETERGEGNEACIPKQHNQLTSKFKETLVYEQVMKRHVFSPGHYAAIFLLDFR